MTEICTPQTLTKNPGIDPPVACGIFLLGDEFDLSDAQDMMTDPPQGLFASQALQDVELTSIFTLGFFESRLGNRPTNRAFVPFSDGGYPIDTTFSFISIADSIVESTPIAQQLDSVPAGQDIFWIGETSDGSFVLGVHG